MTQRPGSTILHMTKLSVRLSNVSLCRWSVDGGKAAKFRMIVHCPEGAKKSRLGERDQRSILLGSPAESVTGEPISSMTSEAAG
jgi:hypothetical protein